MRHYGMQPRHTQPASPHENGAIEQRHYRLKRAVADALSCAAVRILSTVRRTSDLLPRSSSS